VAVVAVKLLTTGAPTASDIYSTPLKINIISNRKAVCRNQEH